MALSGVYNVPYIQWITGSDTRWWLPSSTKILTKTYFVNYQNVLLVFVLVQSLLKVNYVEVYCTDFEKDHN